MRTIIEDFEFETIIGCLQTEKTCAQNVKFDIEYESSKFIDYTEFASFVREIYDKEKFELVETSLEITFKKLKEKFPNLTFLKMKILKTNVFCNAKFGAMLEKKF